MVTVSELVFTKIASEGGGTVFMVAGDSNLHLVDALGRNAELRYVCNHHEQACVMAAEGFCRANGDGLGVALVGSGPSATNAITGVLAAWNDGVPLLVISGQTDSSTLIGDTGLRQRGVQEVDIVSMVSGITKYAVCVTDPTTIKYHLEQALFLARHERPGPVWLDIPIDVQQATVNIHTLRQFFPKESDFSLRQPVSDRIMDTVFAEIGYSNRPVVLLGNGVRNGHAEETFIQFIEQAKIPVVTTKNAFDIIPHDHPLLAGRIGVYGQRAANFAVQNADLLISLGCRLALPTTGYDPKLFARGAMKIVVDNDPAQLQHLSIEADLKVHADCAVFIDQLNSRSSISSDRWEEWRTKCTDWKKRYPAVTDEEREVTTHVNAHHFFEVLSEEMAKTDALVCDQGSAFHSFTGAFKNLPGQRAFSNGGASPMGYGLPAAVGACFSSKVKSVVCVHGDGGLQMNLGELQTMAHHRLPLKLFVLKNNGYLGPKHAQLAAYDGRRFGTDSESGLSFPNTQRLGDAHGIPTLRIENHAKLRETIKKVLHNNGPVLVEVMMDGAQPMMPQVMPKLKPDGKRVHRPLERMSRELPEETLNEEMIVSVVGEAG